MRGEENIGDERKGDLTGEREKGEKEEERIMKGRGVMDCVE